MSTLYKIQNFQSHARDPEISKHPSVKSMNLVLQYATSIMPWIHKIYEWKIIVDEGLLTLVGNLAPHIQMHLKIDEQSHGRLGISLKVDGHDCFGVSLMGRYKTDNHREELLLLDLDVSCEVNNIVGGLSKMLNVYQEHIEFSDGPDKFFVCEKDTEYHYNVLTGSEYTFVVANGLWVSPTQQTFYDTSKQQWVHLKRTLSFVKSDTLLLNSVHTLPPQECV